MIKDDDKAVLQFSGGKDSLACLYLLRPHWNRLTVAWVNTGAAFPETEALMKRIGSMVNLRVIHSDQPAQTAAFGYPVEILPITRSHFGKEIDGHNLPPMQPYAHCCHQNLWKPMMDFMHDIGATLLIRGTKLSDRRKATIRSGATVLGVRHWYPLEHWTDEEVFAYLREIGEIPAHYAETMTSLDCWDCTAYLHENVGKMRYMRERHPEKYRIVKSRLMEIREAVRSELSRIEGAING